VGNFECKVHPCIEACSCALKENICYLKVYFMGIGCFIIAPD
jgi:hypothetical protein